jgi:beta-hydroxylase
VRRFLCERFLPLLERFFPIPYPGIIIYMYILIFSIIIILFFIIGCLEFDRNKRPKISFLEYYNFKSCLLGFLNTLIFLYDKQMIFDENELSIHKKFKKNYDKILNEVNDVYNDYKLINPGLFDDDFRQKNDKYGYYFINYYGNITNNIFPTIESIIRSDYCKEKVETCFISIIDGKKNIPEHRGPFKGLLRYHFTVLSDGSSKNFLKVQNKHLFWREKEGFCFDDTFYHNAKKKTNGLRVVIICDVKRKLPWILDKYNDYCLRTLRNS